MTRAQMMATIDLNRKSDPSYAHVLLHSLAGISNHTPHDVREVRLAGWSKSWPELVAACLFTCSQTKGEETMTIREQYYRYDHVNKGNVTLTIESRVGVAIERRTGKVREMYKYRQLHYPNAHNYRHHFQGEVGCPTCDRLVGLTPESEGPVSLATE